MDRPLHVVDHPLVAHQVATLREVATDQVTFARCAQEITRWLAYEAFRDLPVTKVVIDTPVVGGVVAAKVTSETVLVPILRAGLGLVPALQEVLPVTRVCAIGLRRNEETLSAEVYLDGLPADLTGSRVVVCDPMLATGGSLCQAVAMVKDRGATDITAICLVAAVPGVDRFFAEHPTVPVVTAALDPRLNEHGYIVPGLGDAGDRLFGPPVRP
jgi:uracil phosphoribosyltransferase